MSPEMSRSTESRHAIVSVLNAATTQRTYHRKRIPAPNSWLSIKSLSVQRRVLLFRAHASLHLSELFYEGGVIAPYQAIQRCLIVPR